MKSKRIQKVEMLKVGVSETLTNSDVLWLGLITINPYPTFILPTPGTKCGVFNTYIMKAISNC